MKTIKEIKVERIVDYNTDLSYLGTFGNKKGEYGIEHNGDRNSYPYFNADNVSNMKEAQQNYDRVMQYENGNLCDYGIKATAIIHSNNGSMPSNNWKIDTITSGGLWGLSSDGEESDFISEEDNQIDDLKLTLKEFGFTDEEIAKAPIIR